MSLIPAVIRVLSLTQVLASITRHTRAKLTLTFLVRSTFILKGDIRVGSPFPENVCLHSWFPPEEYNIFSIFRKKTFAYIKSHLVPTVSRLSCRGKRNSSCHFIHARKMTTNGDFFLSRSLEKLLRQSMPTECPLTSYLSSQPFPKFITGRMRIELRPAFFNTITSWFSTTARVRYFLKHSMDERQC